MRTAWAMLVINFIAGICTNVHAETLDQIEKEICEKFERITSLSFEFKETSIRRSPASEVQSISSGSTEYRIQDGKVLERTERVQTTSTSEPGKKTEPARDMKAML